MANDKSQMWAPLPRGGLGSSSVFYYSEKSSHWLVLEEEDQAQILLHGKPSYSASSLPAPLIPWDGLKWHHWGNGGASGGKKAQHPCLLVASY